MGTGLAHTNFLPFPAQSLPQEATNGLDRRDGWGGRFSSCSSYFALFLDPMGVKERVAQLHVFQINASGDTVEKMTLPGMDTAAHERLEVSFHPQQSHFLLISSQRQTPRYQGETTCQLLDMRSGAIERLGSREHPRRCTCSFDILPYIWASRLISSPLIGTSHAEFSACGTYVVKRHDVVELFWRVSVRNFCLDPET